MRPYTIPGRALTHFMFVSHGVACHHTTTGYTNVTLVFVDLAGAGFGDPGTRARTGAGLELWSCVYRWLLVVGSWPDALDTSFPIATDRPFAVYPQNIPFCSGSIADSRAACIWRPRGYKHCR